MTINPGRETTVFADGTHLLAVSPRKETSKGEKKTLKEWVHNFYIQFGDRGFILGVRSGGTSINIGLPQEKHRRRKEATVRRFIRVRGREIILCLGDRRNKLECPVG